MFFLMVNLTFPQADFRPSKQIHFALILYAVRSYTSGEASFLAVRERTARMNCDQLSE